MIVQSTGVIVGRHGERNERVARIEAAMLRAVENATAAGITDPDAVREMILAARDKATD